MASWVKVDLIRIKVTIGDSGRRQTPAVCVSTATPDFRPTNRAAAL
jgi:hypothetical protein